MSTATRIVVAMKLVQRAHAFLMFAALLPIVLLAMISIPHSGADGRSAEVELGRQVEDEGPEIVIHGEGVVSAPADSGGAARLYVALIENRSTEFALDVQGYVTVLHSNKLPLVELRSERINVSPRGYGIVEQLLHVEDESVAGLEIQSYFIAGRTAAGGSYRDSFRFSNLRLAPRSGGCILAGKAKNLSNSPRFDAPVSWVVMRKREILLAGEGHISRVLAKKSAAIVSDQAMGAAGCPRGDFTIVALPRIEREVLVREYNIS